MIELAKVGPHQTLSTKQMAEAQGLSRKYLEQILAALRAAGLVVSFRGFGGGYTLPKAPASIRLGDIYRVFEGSSALVDCVDDPAICPNSETCPATDTWAEMTKVLKKILDGTTLQALIDGQDQPRGPASQPE